MIPIGKEQALHYRNVVSRYYQSDLAGLVDCFNEAMATVSAKYTPAGGFFYAIISDMRKTDHMLAQVFIPIVEDGAPDLPEEYRFQSYFQMLDLIAARALGKTKADFQAPLGALINYCADESLTPVTPPFFRTVVLDGKPYTDIYFGVVPDGYGKGMMVPLHSTDE